MTFASGQQGSPKHRGSWVQGGWVGTGWVAGPGASSLEATLGQPQRWRRRPLSASGFGLRLFLRSNWKGLPTDAGVSRVRAGLVEVRARLGDVGCARTLPFASLLLSSFKGPEPAAISIPGNPQAICEQREPEPSRKAGPVRPSLRSGGSRPGSAAGVPASEAVDPRPSTTNPWPQASRAPQPDRPTNPRRRRSAAQGPRGGGGDQSGGSASKLVAGLGPDTHHSRGASGRPSACRAGSGVLAEGVCWGGPGSGQSTLLTGPCPRVVMAEAEEVGAAVELRGLPPNVPDELLTLYFENHRRSGGGPVLSWQRLGHGGILTFQETADAARVLAQKEHVLHGAQLSLRPAPPRAPARLLLQELPPDTAPQRLEQYVQDLLRAVGHLEQPCHALASPRPDRALVQLPKPLSEAEFRVLEEQARTLGLEGAKVSLAPVPQARAVRVVGATTPVDPLLLELYLENERRSGGGPLMGLRSLPGHLGTVVSFQQWQAAERVLQQDHRLQDSELSLVPHYDVLEPEELAVDTSGGDHSAKSGLGATEHALLEAREPVGALKGVETVSLGCEEAPSQSQASLRTDPIGSLGQAGPVSSEPVGSLGQEGVDSLGLLGSSGQAELVNSRPIGSPGPLDSVESAMGTPEQVGSGSLGPVVSPEQEGLVEKVLLMEPGAMRFIQLYHGDLLAGFGDVALFPLEGSDVTGFRLCGALAPCQAAEEFLQSLLGSISCHMLSLKHPGSARFLLGPKGQHLLQELEAQFQCVFGTELLARDTLDTNPAEVDPTEAFQALPGQSHTLWPPDRTGSDQENLSLEEVRELLATLDGLNGEDWLPLELGEEALEEQPEEEPVPRAEEEPMAPSTGVPGKLEEEAALQLALHRSLEPQGLVAEQEEAAALQQALALSLLELTPLEEEELLGRGTDGQAQLVVHAAFEQDMDELDRALGAALEVHLREETVGLRGHMLPTELRARLERCHGVSVALHNDCTVLRGFGVQPTRAARHLAALLAGPQDQSLTFPLEASSPTMPQQRLKGPLGRLECLAENSSEFQAVVQAFYNTLDTVHSRIRIVRVERVLHPLLQQQYELHRERLEQRCERRPVEHVLYHGTSAPAVPDICAYGFNRSFCGRNGTLYGQGVYFAKHASLSVQDRYSPPNTDGHKAVFVARVLTGDYGKGHRQLRAPPLRDPGHVLLRYDSAVDCLRQPSIFVIFHDTQALPTHLITCEHIPRAPPGNPSELLGHSPAT